MAAKTYALNKYDNEFINDLLLAGVPNKTVTSWINTWQTTAPTYNAKADYMQRMYNAAKSVKGVDATSLLNAAGTWAQSYNPDLINPDTKKPYGLVDFKNAVTQGADTQGSLGDASPNATTQKVLAQIQKARTLQGETIAASLGNDLTGAQTTASAKTIMAGTAAEPFNPDAIHTQYINAAGDYAVKPDDTAATLEAKYGGLKNSSGKPLFTTANFKDIIAGGSDTKLAFNDKIKSYVDTAITTTNGDLAKTKGSLAYRTAANALLNDPSKLADSYNSNVSKLTKDATTGDWSKTTTTPSGVSTGNGITGLLPKGSFKDANGNFAYTGGEIEPDKMTEFTQSYNPNKGVYRAPTMDASGKLVSNPTSPYSNILNGMLSNYKDPFASGYTSSLDSMQPAAMTSTQLASLSKPFTTKLVNPANPTAMTSTQLASLSKPFTTNTTASDLVKLANSAGKEYDSTNKAGSTLSPALSQLYQTQTLPDGTVKAKPGVPDPTKMTVPGANFLDLNGDLLYGNIAGGDLTNTPMGGDAKTATESASGFTPDTTLKNVPGADITNESGTLTKPTITDKATADALHKAEQDRIAEEAAAKAEAAKKALYYNADGTLTGLGYYTYNPTGNYQDYLDKIAADNPTYSFTEGDYVEPSTRARADIQAKAAKDPKLAAQLAWSATQDAARGQNAKYAQPTGTPLTGIASTQAAKDTIADVSSSAIKSPIGGLLSSQNTLNTAPGITTLKGSPGIAGSPNVGSFTSADNMNTSATGVGAPITSLLTPNTGASGTPAVTQKPAVTQTPTVTQKPAVIQQQAVANEPTNDWGVPYSQLRAGSPAKSAAPNPVVTTPYYSNYD
jgi:hypothetical protein